MTVTESYPNPFRDGDEINADGKCTLRVSDPDGDVVMTYEEVERLCPRAGGHHRPIVLVGAPGVGRTELRRRLINSSITHFKQTIPCE